MNANDIEVCSNLALPHINNLSTYPAGKPIEDLAREKNLTKIIKLASNENPYGPSPKVLEIINQNINSINLYPDPEQYLLKQELSKFYNITPDHFLIGNGSDELIRFITQTFVSTEHNIIAPKYSFISYKICAQNINAEYRSVEINQNWQNNLTNILNKIDHKTKLICLANPNNPIGSYLEPQIIKDFIAQVPKNIVLLLDEAYFEYIKYDDLNFNNNNYLDYSIQLTKQYKNLIIMRTFSKAYGLAGLRVGYTIADPAITAMINKIRVPFNVNRLAQVAAIAAIQDQDYIKKLVKINHIERLKLYKAFDHLKINYIPSKGNFITVAIKDSDMIYNKLLDHGIIVRPLNSYGLVDYLRVSIGTPEENDCFITTLTNII